MGKNPKSTGSDALSQFRALEDRVHEVIRVVRQTRQEKESLSERLRLARTQIQTLESEVRELQKSRKSLRTRVEGMIRQIDEAERANLKDKEKRVV